ncbi:MAG: NAD(P)H-quinone oxidoreductase [Candidatus Palauibacterales bacterium]|nr:NAD(P)H-quinone oxidoreductase [Candidatus Palauibacterales bacterium]MDP2528152.1 NAD(P)H-quinone oxidoreductase [Candidatus Palauibacterales bacterium]MDP2584230.1 NAD(P)H-quinone oxidoreductase [Candidatus Palauibacterales bacterium]
MQAIRITRPGGPQVLRLEEVPDPEPGLDDVLVDVRAAALNRADLLQRQGHYPAPPGAPADIPGLEMAGVVAAVGGRVRDVSPGDRVMALLGGGGYAERVVVPAGMVLQVPPGLSLVEAAALPEVFYTAYDALFRQAGLAMGESVLVHAAGGGVGTAALQLARAGGAARIFGTASSAKLTGIEREGLPLDIPIDYRTVSFEEVVRERTEGRGVDVILDMVGGDYLGPDLRSLAELGRVVLVGLLRGRSAEADLGLILGRRLRVLGTVLRARSAAEKLTLTAEVRDRLLPLFEQGRLRPVVDRTYPLAEAELAHRSMDANQNLGKIVLEVESRAASSTGA